ncbi:hypothetical protein DXG01_005088 [Tephrocybe rancida]|nr:hypothetical protein DXG01_005088 [Tephrocybe rancida]
MTFNQKVNPRLASHALVHGLIRRNQLKDAAHLAVSMMQYGMRVHTRTLDAVMNTLEPNYFSKKSSVKSTMPPNFIPNPKSLGDLAPMAQHATSRLALEIFTVARKTGQGDTRGLFATLLAICLLNAEIVLACLVFGTTIKEFYHPPPCPEGDTASTTWNADKYGPRSLLFLPTWGHLNYILAPMTDYFRYVVTLRTTSPEFEQSALDANLQALAILANLLDFRQLHLSTISSLLALMYSTPRVDAEVWVMDKGGNNRQVVAFAYFHDVLVRLIESPPGSRTSSNKKSTRAFTPPLGLKSSNTLLHYALRHCQSPDLGNKVIVHLTEARKLALDQTTYNILLRSGTLMRDNDLASLAVTAVASKSPPSKSLSKHSSKDPPRNHRPSKRPDLHENTPLRALALSEHEAVRSIASTIETLQSVELWMMSRNRQARIDTAVYNLTTHLMHLTSTGQPHVAITVIFALFPALQVCTSLKEQVRIRRKEVVRASRYGPITFTVLLHALVKAKAFLEARLFYTFACKAERRSWFTPAPWAFGPEFYTVMLELCTAECVEASRLESRASSAVEKAAVKTMRLRTLRMALRQYLRINKVPFEAHYTMENSGHSEHIHKLVFPKRDERLSTALIEVLVQHFKYADPASLPVPDIATGSNHPPHALTGTSAESVARTFDDTERDFIERGVLPRGWSPALQFIARGIIQAGMEIPPALRHLFLGRYDAAARPRGRGVSLRVVPWAYSTEGTEAQNPWRVPSLRTRGLARPTRRRNRTSRSRTF